MTDASGKAATITTDLVRAKFEALNRQCFGGKLPLPPIRLSTAKGFLGAITFRMRTDNEGRVVRSNYVLVVSTRFEQSEVELEDTILHEMIHYFIYLSGIEDTSPHGVVFRQMMADLNRRHGRHIAISHRQTAIQHAQAPKPTPRIVCISQWADGRLGITVSARTRVFEINRTLPRRYPLKQTRWFFSADPWFCRYPRCNTAKVYAVSNEKELLEHLATAVELEFVGSTLRRKPMDGKGRI